MEENKKLSVEEQVKKMSYFNESEMELVRGTFRTREIVLTLRKFLWQLPLTKEEKSLLERNIGKKFIDILRKTFIPTLNSTESLEEMKDIWLFDFENMTPQYSVLLFKVRNLVGKYFTQKFLELEGNQVLEPIDFNKLSDFVGKTDEDAYVEMSARNMIARETQRYLWFLHILAEPKETEEQMMARHQKDSTL
jgi:hypothetical protein